MNKFFKFLGFFLLILNLKVEAKLPPSISTGGNTLNIIFAVDISGSMFQGAGSYFYIEGYINGNTLFVRNSINSSQYCSSLNNTNGYYVVAGPGSNLTLPGTQINSTAVTSGSGQIACTISINKSQTFGSSNSPKALYIESLPPRYLSVQQAIAKITSDKSLASQANFSLLTWGSSTKNSQSASNCLNGSTYTWVPLNTNKTQNFSDIQTGLNCINAAGGGTNIDPPMSFIQTYINSATFSPFDQCATTIVIVMSDGLWSTNGAASSVATTLKNRSRPIKTYAVAMDISPTNTTFINLATSGGTISSPGVLGGNPVDAASLTNAFKAAIQSALFDNYSAVAPTIMQKTSTNALILVPDFQYKATTQWPGHLTASNINADGSINTSSAWEFGANLNNTSPDSRYIWTAAPGLPVNTSSTPNNFTTSNLTNIANAMGNSTILTAQLINFIRGYDAFDENANGSTTDQRWKLNDIYNSKPAYVAQPEQTITSDPNFAGSKEYFYKLNPSAYATFLNNTKNRKAMIYVGSNGGVLHAIDADSGSEVWAFVPPPLLDKLDNIVSSALPNATNSIYGVDGSPVAQDVYINGSWKTYLAVTLGNGARGYSVLDITNPLTPLHVFSIERYQAINGAESTRWWTSNGTLNTNTNIPGLDNIYQTLGFTTSTPVFSYAKSLNGSYSPVLILGEGTSNNGLTNIKIYLGTNPTFSSIGSGALIVGLVPGQEGMIIHNKDVGYTSTGDSQTATTSILAIQASTSVSNSYSVEITNTYALDEGASVTGTGVPSNTVVISLDSSTQVTFNNPVSVNAGTTLTFTRRIFNEVMAPIDILESGSTPYMQGKYGYRMLVPNNNGYIHSFSDLGNDPSTIDYPYASFSSTAPRGAYGAFRTINSGTTFYNDRLIQQPLSISNYVANSANQLNIVYGTGDMETLSIIDKSPDNLIVSVQDTENNIFALNKSRSFLTTNSSLWGSSSFFMDATNNYSMTCQNTSQQGWYVRMNGINALDENNISRSCNYAKLAAKIETYGGLVAAPIYIPPTDLNSCSLGSSALIFRDAKCGYQSGPPLYLSNMLIGGITTFKNNIYISVSSKSTVTKIDAQNKYTKVGAVVTGQPGFNFRPAILKGRLRIR